MQRADPGGWSAAYDRADRRYGPLGIVRVFHPGLPPAFPGSPADLAGRAVHISFKARPGEVLAGEHDDLLAAWFASLPADRDIYWTYFHEPEDDIADGRFTAPDYRGAWQRMAGVAAQARHPRLFPTLVLMGWTLEPGSGRNWRDYYPGPTAVAVLAWDVYNFDRQAGRYSEPAVLFDKVIEVSRRAGKPWGVAEFGARLVPGDRSGSRRGEWIRVCTDYLARHDHPPLWITWYDADLGAGDDYRLRDQPSRHAWRQFARGG